MSAGYTGACLGGGYGRLPCEELRESVDCMVKDRDYPLNHETCELDPQQRYDFPT